MDFLKRLSGIFDKLLIVVIIILFILMFGVTNLHVIMRYFFNKPIIFSVEMGRYCFVSIIFLGAIFTTREDRHIHVDFFTGLMPEKVRFVFEQIGRILMTGIFGVLTYYTVQMAIANRNVVSSAMQIPMAVPYSVMAFGCLGIAIESAKNVILYQLGIKKKEKGPEEVDD